MFVGVWSRPLFTLLSYALTPLGLAASVWAFKAVVAAASLSCVALVWSCARARGMTALYGPPGKLPPE